MSPPRAILAGIPVGEDFDAGSGAQTAAARKPRVCKRGAAEKQPDRFSGCEESRRYRECFRRKQTACEAGARGAGFTGFAPGKIRRHNQGGHFAGRSDRRRHGCGSGFAHSSGAFERAHPARNRPRETFDIGG